VAATNDQWQVAQIGPVALFDRGIKGVAIDMADTQLLKLGVNDDARRATMGTSRARGCAFLARLLARRAPLRNVGGRERCFAFATKAGHCRAPKDVPQFLTTIGFTLEFSSKIY
jgi:hypothetical protein